MASIQALNIYPVKSCRGVALEQAQVTLAGFAHDREWMIVRGDGRFVTQREQPRLALIEPVIVERFLELRAPGTEPLRVSREADSDAVEVLCWNDRCAAFDAGAEAAGWLSDYLGTPHRLVRFDPRRKRLSNPEWSQHIEAQNRFTDAYPWLIVSQASLDDLNSRLPEPLPMNRFRPNIVLGDIAAYAEDTIDEIVAGNVRLKLVKPCTRCAITTTDQATGERNSDQPLRTLKQYRFSREMKGVLFGQNAILMSGLDQSLSVGQPVSISWKREELS
jgi:uncharacterized protein YcbX